MLLTRYGAREVALSLVAWTAAAAALWVYVHPAAAAGPAALLLFTLYFFRDPRRLAPEGQDLVLAPADGRVVDIEEVDDSDFVGERALRVGIFLSLFDVHINRAPVAGRVEVVRYRPGKFLAAFNERATSENEANYVGLATGRKAPSGDELRVGVKQISGIIARRIVCACAEGQDLASGERFGMIKFGSRTELYLPAGSLGELRVKVGDKVRAGATVIGRLA